MFRPKIKHVRHPIRTLTTATKLLAIYVDIWRFGRHSYRAYRRDIRFNLDNVSRGFAAHCDDSCDDTEILRRICKAYARAIKDEPFAPEAYRASGWWQRVRDSSLGPVMRALAAQDIPALAHMYRNFFRDACSTGLVSVPYSMSNAYFSEKIRNLHRRFYLGNALQTLDYWEKQTGGSFQLHALAGPDIGNPFGILLNGTLVRTGAAYQHYAARGIIENLDSMPATVVEIGGGYGGTAYYLLRDRPGVRYIDFDVPESLALTSYYLLRSFPQLTFLLYGEDNHAANTFADADVVLMPTYAIDSLPDRIADVVFSSHALSDLSSGAMEVYLPTVERITKGRFLYIGDAKGVRLIESSARRSLHHLQLRERKDSLWNRTVTGAEEVECLFAPSSRTRERCTGNDARREEREQWHSLAR